ESAWSVISQVTDDLLYRFDQACRVKAIEMASALGMQTDLSINFLPNAVYEPEACIQATLEVSQRVGWPTHRLIFEITETEEIEDYIFVNKFIQTIKGYGARVAIDDFGTGYANFEHIISLDVDFIKIDGSLIRNIDTNSESQAIAEAIVAFSQKLGSKTIVEFVHNEAVYEKVKAMGADYSQGYFLGEPSPTINP
ncbi:MAG: EAL domain-containing protein, partial [Sulfurimonas sp.]